MTFEEKIEIEPLYILLLDSPTDEQIKLAIREGGPELLHIFLTDDLFDYFCKEFGDAELTMVKDLNKLSKNKKKEVIFKDYTLISKMDLPSEDLQIFAINRNPEAVLLMDNASITAWKTAIMMKPELIQFYNKPNEELQMTAVRSNVKSIKYIQEPTKKVQLYTIRLGAENIINIKNIHPDVACECIKKYGIGAFMVLRRTDKLVLELIKERLKNI